MIRYILGWVLVFEGGFLLLPSITSVIYNEKEGTVYLAVAAISVALGFLLTHIKKPDIKNIFAKEGFAVVSLSWVLLSMVGAVPMYLTGEIPSYVNALFETISGFTTTGSSILSDVEVLSKTTSFWRLFTHWVGGMGFLVFIMAILPLAGGSTMHLMKAESPGPQVGKFVPRAKKTALILYEIYIFITVLETITLIIVGLKPFDALTLTFATVGTGGFGLLNSSIASYSMAVQIVITLFMIISSINFSVYYLFLIRKPKEALKFEEMINYLAMVFIAAGLITANLVHGGFYNHVGKAFQQAIFQVASVTSTTGFCTTDFNTWPSFSKTILFLLMFVGACAGSTGGGFKVSRLAIFVKNIKCDILSVIHPRSVIKVRYNGKQITDKMLYKILCYLAIYVMVIIVSVLLVSIDGKDMETNISAVMATFNNIGPGFGQVGASSNFDSYGVFAKFVLMFDMLIGRLELYPILIIFLPEIWMIRKKNK